MRYLSSAALIAVSLACSPSIFGQQRNLRESRELPRAHAGTNRTTSVGTTVILDGSASTDPQARPLTYEWSLFSQPAGSTARLSNPNIPNPAISPDVPGTYAAQLVVNNGIVSSVPSTVVVTTLDAPLATDESAHSTMTPFANPVTGTALNLGIQPNVTSPGGPQPDSVTPPSGNSATQTFTFNFSDPNGWQQLQVVDIIFNRFLDGRHACYIAFVPSSGNAGSVFLVDDAGDAGGPYSGFVLPGNGTAQNSQCTINGAGSSLNANGNTLSLTLAITFSAAFGGNKVTFLSAQDKVGGNSGWQSLGVYGVPPLPTGGPQVGGMSPTRTTGNGQVYTFTFTDTNGWQDIAVADVLVNTFIDGRHACYIAFVPNGPSSGSVFLVDDAGDAGGPFQGLVLPGSGTASNSQCSISGNGSSVSGNGNTLTLLLNISFTSAFAGNRVFFPSVRNNGAGNSDWQPSGTVTVPSPAQLLAFLPSTVSIATGPQNLSLTLSSPQASALVVNLSSSNTGVATVPASVNIPANATSVNVPVTGVSGGTTTITASAAGIPNATAAVTVCTVCSAITVSPGSVGVNLQTLISITLNPAPVNATAVTLTTGDPSKFLVAAQGTAPGTTSATLMLSASVGATQAFIQGIAPGTATLTASAGGYTVGTATVTVTPSGFVLSGVNGIGASFQTFPGISTPLTINSARLDANNNFVQIQQLRPTASATVQLNNSTPATGSVTPTSVSFNAGDDTKTATFSAGGSPGSTTITATPPAGFSAPKLGGLPANSLFITVQPQGLAAQNATVGQSLETTTFTKLNGVATQSECPGTGGLLVTLTSNSPSLLLSATAAGAGSGQIMVCIPPGGTRTPDYFVYGLANSGNATYTASSSIGTSTGSCAGPTPTGCVTFVPSGIVISGPSGNPGQGYTTGTSQGPANITVFSVTLNGGTVGMSQAVAGGTNVSVNVNSSNTAVGTVNPTTVNIAPGTQGNTTTFTPVGAGMTNLTVNVPSGFSTPNANLTSVPITVLNAGFLITDGNAGAPIFIGNNLEIQGMLTAGAPGPATITLTSNSPNLKLSATANGVGASQIQVNLPANSTGPVFYYLQSTGSSGTASYTATAPGYTSRTASNFALTPSGFVIVGPFGAGQGWNFPAPASVGVQTQLQVLPAQLDAAGNFVQTEFLSGSAPAATVPITVTGVGNVTPSPAIVMPGTSGAVTLFSSAAAGSSKVSITQPAGYTKPVGVQGFQLPGPSCPSVANCPDPTFVVLNVK